MLKKALGLVMLAVMLLGVFGLTACNGDFAQYKTDAKAELTAYADAICAEIDCLDDSVTIRQIEDSGKKAIDGATTKLAVNAARDKAKADIDAVEQNGGSITFPSVLEDIRLGDFTEELFENYTLILVPFEHPHLLYGYLDFYTVFVEDGKLNFLIEITDQYNGGDDAIDNRLFAVIISNEIFNKYEIGVKTEFCTYDFSGTEPVEKSRDWLSEIENKSIDHRVGFISYEAIRIDVVDFREIITVSSVEILSDYFYMEDEVNIAFLSVLEDFK